MNEGAGNSLHDLSVLIIKPNEIQMVLPYPVFIAMFVRWSSFFFHWWHKSQKVRGSILPFKAKVLWTLTNIIGWDGISQKILRKNSSYDILIKITFIQKFRPKPSKRIFSAI